MIGLTSLGDQAPDAVANATEALAADDVDLAWPREIDRDRLDDPSGPRTHHQHGVGEVDRLGQAVGDEEYRLAGLFPDVEQVVPHAGARLLVERRKGLVHQDQTRVLREAARDGDALPHAARQLVRIVVRKFAQAHELEQRRATLAPRRAVHPAQVEREFHVGERGFPRQQRRVLEHHPDLVRHGCANALAFDARLPARRRDQAGEDLEQRGLAATARSDQRDEPPFLDRERDVGKRAKERAAGAEILSELADLDDRHQEALARKRPTRSSASRIVSLTAMVKTETSRMPASSSGT